MQSFRPLFKPCLIDSSLICPPRKEDLLSVSHSLFSGQTTYTNQYVGVDAGESSAQDSCISKHTKITQTSRSSIFDGLESLNQTYEMSQKYRGKELKKEMKKQKIKRKQQERKKLVDQKYQKSNLTEPSTAAYLSSSFISFSEKKNIQKSFSNSSLCYKIQKLTQDEFANLIPKKKIHTQISQASSKSNFPYLRFLELDEIKACFDSFKDMKMTEKIISQQTEFPEDQSHEIQIADSNELDNYFVDDLKKQAMLKTSQKHKSKMFPKLNFVQSMMNLSQFYQLPIENQKPQDSNVQKIFLEKRSADNGKKTLLIDLDDTLIFTSKPVSIEDLKSNENKTNLITQNDGKVRKLYIRPHAKEFLNRLSKYYEIIIFTAATKGYGQQIRSILDPQNKIISHLLDRQHCFNPNINGQQTKLPFIKDLRKINRDLTSTVLLDNSIYCFWYQIHNGIPITSYNKENHLDNELLKAQKYLMQLLEESDVRIKNKTQFKLDQYEEYVDSLTLVQELYLENQEQQ